MRPGRGVSYPSVEILGALNRILLRRNFVGKGKTVEALGEEGGGFKVHRHVFGDGEDLPGFGVADFFGGSCFFSKSAEPPDRGSFPSLERLGGLVEEETEEAGGFSPREEEGFREGFGELSLVHVSEGAAFFSAWAM